MRYYRDWLVEIIFAIFKYKSRSAAVAMLAWPCTTALIPSQWITSRVTLNEVAGWNLLLFISFPFN